MATQKQVKAAKRNVTKARAGAQKKRSIASMPAKTRTALGKQGAAVAQRKRTGSSSPKTRQELYDEAKRKDILHEAQEMQHNEGGYIVQYFSNIIDAHSATIGGLVEAKCGFPFGNYWLKNVGFVA